MQARPHGNALRSKGRGRLLTRIAPHAERNDRRKRLAVRLSRKQLNALRAVQGAVNLPHNVNLMAQNPLHALLAHKSQTGAQPRNPRYIDCAALKSLGHLFRLLEGDGITQTARVCPGLLAVAPGGLMQEIADFSLLYSQLLLLYYRFTGEKETVDRYYGIADGILKHFSQYAREDGLLEHAGR